MRSILLTRIVPTFFALAFCGVAFAQKAYPRVPIPGLTPGTVAPSDAETAPPPNSRRKCLRDMIDDIKECRKQFPGPETKEERAACMGGAGMGFAACIGVVPAGEGSSIDTEEIDSTALQPIFATAPAGSVVELYLITDGQATNLGVMHGVDGEYVLFFDATEYALEGFDVSLVIGVNERREFGDISDGVHRVVDIAW